MLNKLKSKLWIIKLIFVFIMSYLIYSSYIDGDIATMVWLLTINILFIIYIVSIGVNHSNNK